MSRAHLSRMRHGHRPMSVEVAEAMRSIAVEIAAADRELNRQRLLKAEKAQKQLMKRKRASL